MQGSSYIHLFSVADILLRYKSIVGFCASAKENDNNRIGAMYVLPNYQRQGIGNLLITEAFNWLGHINDIFVNVARYNLQAIEFYKKFCFVETGKSGVLDSASQLPSGKSIPEIEMVRKSNHSLVFSFSPCYTIIIPRNVRGIFY